MTGAGPPIPMVARHLGRPWRDLLRAHRFAQPHWIWPEAVDGLVDELASFSGSDRRIVREAVAGAEDRAGRELERGERLGYRLLVPTQPAFPEGLQAADVWALWFKGVAHAFDRPRVAIVGSREATPHGLTVAERLGRELAGSGLTVVSGLARGIDSAAHRGALEAGTTLAVFGSGLAMVYPREHASLAAAVAERGALLSEFHPDAPPRAAHFPQRNRIIAALSTAVVVVEAGERSGSLSTARWALDLGRDVLVVPSNVLHGRNRGGHALIRDGATLVEDTAQVLACVPDGTTAEAPGVPGRLAPAPGEQGPAEFRDGEVIDVESLAESSRRPIEKVLCELATWELEGRVRCIGPGRFLCLARK